MARRRYNYLPQSELDERGCNTRHRFQSIAVKNLVETLGCWRVSSINHSSNYPVTVVVVRLIADNSIGCAVYPDGSFARSKSPKVKWDWHRARIAAEATIPDIYVKNILEQNQAVSS